MSPSPAETLGRRIGAALVDLLVVGLLLVVVGLIFGEGHSGHGRVGVSLHGVSSAIWAISALLYYLLLEFFTGRTLGKYLLGISVTTADGYRPAAGAIIVRNLLRIIDFLPFFYMIGFISILATRSRAQRLGDMASGTTVAYLGAGEGNAKRGASRVTER